MARFFTKPQDGYPVAFHTVSLVTIVLLIGSAIASAQSTRPDSDPSTTWAKTVSSIAAAAVAHDSQTLQSLIDPDCQIRRFNADGNSDVSDFTDFAIGNSILGDHAYTFPDQTAIADIARDINSSSLVSDYQRKELSMGDSNQKSAVSRWLAQSLDAQDGELIGIIVLWDSRAETDDMHRPNFILIKAQKSDGVFKPTQIVYGDPLQ